MPRTRFRGTVGIAQNVTRAIFLGAPLHTNSPPSMAGDSAKDRGTLLRQKSRRNLCLGQVVVVCTEKKDAEDEDHVGRIQRALTKIMPYLYQSQARRLLDNLVIAIERRPYHFERQSAMDLLGESILDTCKKDVEPHDSMSIEKAVTAGAAPKPKKDWLESFLQGLGYTK